MYAKLISLLISLGGGKYSKSPPPPAPTPTHGYTPESYILLSIYNHHRLLSHTPSTPPALSPSGQTQIDHSDDRPCPLSVHLWCALCRRLTS